MTENSPAAALPADAALVLHKLRPQWGPALLILEEETRRTYQFQDGQLRKLKEGWYHMMVPFESTEARADVLREDLEELHQVVSAERAEHKELMAQAPVMSFQDQLRVFTHLYPQGFQDPAYMNAWRAPVDSRASKRHVDSALAAARERLSEEALDALLAEGDSSGVMDALLAVLAETSLATPSKVTRPLAAIPAERHEELARALRTLLHGEGAYKIRFREWLLVLGEIPGLELSWPLLTLPAALLRPKKQCLVKPAVYKLQARILGVGSGPRKRPTPRGYVRARTIARATLAALEEAGLDPADLIDARNFTWETLRPKGQDLLKELGRKRGA